MGPKPVPRAAKSQPSEKRESVHPYTRGGWGRKSEGGEREREESGRMCHANLKRVLLGFAFTL